MKTSEMYTRRDFFKNMSTAAAGTVLAATGLCYLPWQMKAWATNFNASSLYEQYDFLMPRVRFKDRGRATARWNVYPGADRNLLMEFSKVVQCDVLLPTGCNGPNPLYGNEHHFNAVVQLNDYHQIKRYPFLFMTGEEYYSLDKKSMDNLQRYLCEGGFVLMDDCVLNTGRRSGGDFFYQSSYKILEELFGSGSVKMIPKQHEVFHNVYDFGDKGMPFVQGQNHGARGVFIEDRLAVFLSSTDIHCGWCKFPGLGQTAIQGSLQMGVNILMYALSR